MNLKFKIEKIPVHYLRMGMKPEREVALELDYSFKELLKPINKEVYLNLYKTVGLKYNWLDRLVITEDELQNLLNLPKTHIFILNIRNQLAGWAEFTAENEYTELLYFGLLPNFIGKGIGKFFLSLCIKQAWYYNPKWVQLNTCDLDHENALLVYKSLGFVEYKTIIEERKVQVN